MATDRDPFCRLSQSEQSQVNTTCDRFEEALQERRAPRLEDSLADTAGLVREVLLRELLVLECEYSLRQGLAVDSARLAARFPGREALIAEAIELARHNQALRSTPPDRNDDLASQRAALAAFPETIGRFRLLSVLGHGSFGIVFHAVDTADGNDVALKVPHIVTLVTPQLRERFLREARTASLDHPRIVKIREVGEAGLVCYIASEYIPGTTLAVWLRQRYQKQEQIPFRQAAQWTALLAEAVHHAHEHGVLHCDLKPSNVLLRDAPEMEPVLTDFGLARLIEERSELTRTGQFFGTPAYMAPEQATGPRQDLTAATDVYGIGAILYELFTGRPPFQAANMLELLELKRNSEPLSPRVLVPGIPRDLDTICLKCLHKEPHRRYLSAADLVDDLRRFLEGRPINARPVDNSERFWRWCRRRPGLAGLTAALVLVILVSFAVVVSLWQQAEASRAQAQQSRTLAVEQLRAAEASRRDAEDSHAGTLRLVSRVIELAGTTPEVLGVLEKKCQDLLRKRPGDTKLLAVLGKAYLVQAERHTVAKQTVQAVQAARQAVHFLREALQSEEVGKRQHLLDATILLDLGMAHKAAGELADAHASFRQAATACTRAAQQPSPDSNDRLELARTCLAVGHYLRTTGAPTESPDQLELARQLFAEVARENPGNLWHLVNLSNAWYQLGQTRRILGQHDKALAAYRQAVTVQRTAFEHAPEEAASRERLSLRYSRLAHWLRLRGSLAEAADMLLEQKKLWPKNAEMLLQVSRDLAALAEAVGGGRSKLTPKEQEERQHYLDLSAAVAREAQS